MRLQRIFVGFGLLAAVTACGEEADSASTDVELPKDGRYEFSSRFDAEGHSVSHSGQTLRHLLIIEVGEYIKQLAVDLDNGDAQPAPGEVYDSLESLYVFDSELLGGRTLSFETAPAPLQTRFNDVSSGKNLQEKFAGNDSATDHADWTAELLGWEGHSSAQSLLLDFFQQLDDAAIARLNGDMPWGADVPFYVTAGGLDLYQLTVKWLLMGVTYSQGTDDYLDDADEGKGLLAANVRDDESLYTSLEHAWDEGFGYFGAARDYADYTDALVAEKGFRDTDGSGDIDLVREACFGASVNAAKRDLGAVVSTDFTKGAFSAFLEGRAFIASMQGEPGTDQLTRLQQLRDQAVAAWEGAIAATVVHYINDLLQDTAAYDTPEEDVAAAAKHFGELKGFALGLQFNPRSRLSGADFMAFHEAVGDAPVLPGGDVEAYRSALRSARDILGDVYDFAPENLGDAEGTGGW